jgi:tryptophan synthase alpha chain
VTPDAGAGSAPAGGARTGPAGPAAGRAGSTGPAAGAGPLQRAFAARRAEGQAAFVPFLPHGYPSPDATPRLLRRLAAAGADVIELGVPFSDPLADGPTIQRASWEALEHGVRLEDTLELVEELADDLPPLVLFSYLNPILRMGVDRFAERAAAVGVAGVLVTDLPVGTDLPLERRLAGAGPDLIRLVAPTTPDERLSTISETASGFLYYISRTGVTGEREELDEGLEEAVARLRRRVRLPVAVGFGISRPEQARTVARVADGVVVGSALVTALRRDEEAFADLAAALAEATHGA